MNRWSVHKYLLRMRTLPAVGVRPLGKMVVLVSLFLSVMDLGKFAIEFMSLTLCQL